MHLLSTRTPIIKLIDADNVLFVWTLGLSNVLLGMDPSYPIVPEADRDDWNMLTLPGADPAILKEAMNSPGFYRDLPLMPGAVEGMKRMIANDKATGDQTFICTTPAVTNPTCASEKMESIERHFGSYWPERTILTADKTLVHGDVLWDDKPIITGVRTPDWEHILFRQPHNRKFNPRLVANGWDDVDRTLELFREGALTR